MNYLNVILGALVWKKLISLKHVIRIKERLSNRINPKTIEEVVEELRKAAE